MRVIGSHAISTRPLASFTGVLVAIPLLLTLALVPGQQFLPGSSPLRFLVDGLLRDLAEASDGPAVDPAAAGGDLRAGRFVHERHELVGEAGHRAADADAADVGATPYAVDPAPLGDVALHDRAPAPELHDALRRAVL